MKEDILYFQVDISGWSKKAKDFLKKYLDCPDVYIMGLYDGMKEEELDHYVALRGTGERISRVFNIISDKYKCDGTFYKQNADEKVFPVTPESTITYKQFIDRWVSNKEHRNAINAIESVARETMV